MHVLEGVLFKHSLTKCYVCQGTRCFRCADQLAAKIHADNGMAALLGPEGVCRRCGKGQLQDVAMLERAEKRGREAGKALGRAMLGALGRGPGASAQ